MKQKRKRPKENILNLDLQLIPESPGYLISENGVVYSVMELTPYLDQDGYERVHLFIDGKHKRPGLHQLLAKTFLPTRRSDQTEVRHLDGTRSNNKLSNLAWGNKKENGADKSIHGSILGERNPNCKLTVLEVAHIKERLFNRESIKSISEDFDVGYSTIEAIKSGRNWSHVKRSEYGDYDSSI